MPRRPLLPTVVAALLLAGSAFAQDFWVKKPYSQWSKAETAKMLSDSPWARHANVSADVAMAITDPSGQRNAGLSGQQETAPRVTYTVQLRSARPIRQAVVRERQLQQQYDRMPPEQKAALDARTNAYLAAPQDDIVVYVAYDSNVPNYVDLLRRYWEQQTYEIVKNAVALKIGGAWLSPTGYAATNGAFQFNFARPASLPREGNVVLQFESPATGALRAERVVIEFRLDKMLLDGQPVL